LIDLSTKNFNQIDEYLRTQNRGDLSVLILIGSWVEGLHIFNTIAKENPSEDITKRIGEQKLIIDYIYAILSKIENIAYYKDLKQRLSGLKNVYANVQISYLYQEPTVKEVKGELFVEDNSKSVVRVSKDDLISIDTEIIKLRREIFMTDRAVTKKKIQ
jgi:hypothetical protein